MDSTNDFKKTIMFFVRRSIVLFVGGCFAVAWCLFYEEAMSARFFHRGNIAIIILYVFFYHMFTSFYGGYRIGSQRLTDTVYSNLLSLFMVNAFIYFQMALINRGFLSFLPLLSATIIQIGIIFLWTACVTRIYFKIFDPVDLVCLYGGEYPNDIIKRFCALYDKFHVIGSIRISPEDNINYESVLQADGVVIYMVPHEKYAEILKLCVEKNLRYYLVPTIGDILLQTSNIIYLGDQPLFMSKNEGLFLGQRCTKRVFDIFLAVIALIMASPIMLLIAACVKINDGGPIFYKQRRCTQHGRIFSILKFRSMKENAENDGKARLAAENDARITSIGRILRKYRFDELPQLFNILKGDMSFVGPRPERPELIEEYKTTLPEFDYRLNVQCGLTGYAQVMGRYNTTPLVKLKLDLIYIQNYSFLLDIKIILMTIKVVFSKESTIGIVNPDNDK